MASFIDTFSDLKELGIDCEDDSLTDKFNKAANHLPNLIPKLDNQTLLNLYGYYKQGSQGSCNTPKPSWYDMKAKSKWEAWNKLGDLSQKEAKSIYISTIKKLDPGFEVSGKDSWVSVSMFKNPNQEVSGKTTIIDDVKEDKCEELERKLKIDKAAIDELDTDGLGLIHWASDRGSVDALNILLKAGANIDLQDSDGQTALHYAASCGHIDCIKFLLKQNAKLDIPDSDGSTAKDVASDDTVKELLTN